MAGGGFYTAGEAALITRVPLSTINWWVRRGVIEPEHPGRPRLFTFLNLRDICVVRQLREQGATLKAFLAAIRWVRVQDDVSHPVEAGFWVDAGGVVYDEDSPVRADLRGQRLWQFFPTAARSEVRTTARIDVSPTVRGGAPVIRGTRVPAIMIAQLSGAGVSVSAILSEYGVSEGDVAAAVEYYGWELGAETG